VRHITRKKISLIVLAILGSLLFTYIAAGSVIPRIVIDGKTIFAEPAPRIDNNRTMVPIRFIVEDEALKGEVFWDARQQKVAVNLRGKYIELFIGSKKAAIDGKTVYLDAAPYIYQGRTFVPLRFIAEAAGAEVEWKESTQEVIIDFEPAAADRIVFAYYYYRSFAELKANAHLLTDISFRWFQTDGEGRLFYEYQDDYDQILKFTQKQGIKTHAGAALMDRNALHQLLVSPENRARLIGNLLDRVKRDNYDGVNIDFEFIDPADAGYFTLFIKELKTSLGPEKQLSVAVFARTAGDNWATPYEYKKIGEIADLVVVMAYDYSYKTSAPGPVAPLWWVEKTVAYMTANIEPEKILLGIPTYGYDWADGQKTTTVTGDKLAQLKQAYKLNETFDTKSWSPSYTYWDSNGQFHQIWMENQASINAKYDLAIKNNLGGISFWRIGNGCSDLYNILSPTQ